MRMSFLPRAAIVWFCAVSAVASATEPTAAVRRLTGVLSIEARGDGSADLALFFPDGKTKQLTTSGRVALLSRSAVTDAILSARISPDGRRIAYVERAAPAVGHEPWETLSVMNSDGSEKRVVLRRTDSELFADVSLRLESFQWAQDGRNIAFAAVRLPEKGKGVQCALSSVYEVPAAGGSPKLILPEQRIGRLEIALWDADERRLVLVRDCPSETGTSRRLVTVALDGRVVRERPAQTPSISPDGHWLIERGRAKQTILVSLDSDDAGTPLAGVGSVSSVVWAWGRPSAVLSESQCVAYDDPGQCGDYSLSRLHWLDLTDARQPKIDTTLAAKPVGITLLALSRDGSAALVAGAASQVEKRNRWTLREETLLLTPSQALRRAADLERLPASGRTVRPIDHLGPAHSLPSLIGLVELNELGVP